MSKSKTANIENYHQTIFPAESAAMMLALSNTLKGLYIKNCGIEQISLFRYYNFRNRIVKIHNTAKTARLLIQARTISGSHAITSRRNSTIKFVGPCSIKTGNQAPKIQELMLSVSIFAGSPNTPIALMMPPHRSRGS